MSEAWKCPGPLALTARTRRAPRGFSSKDSTAALRATIHPSAGSTLTCQLAAQEPAVAPLIIDQVSSFRGADDVTCTPNSASAHTIYSCVLVIGTTLPEA